MQILDLEKGHLATMEQVTKHNKDGRPLSEIKMTSDATLIQQERIKYWKQEFNMHNEKNIIKFNNHNKKLKKTKEKLSPPTIKELMRALTNTVSNKAMAHDHML